MKTMMAEKPIRKETRTHRGTGRAQGRTHRGRRLTGRTPVDRQVAEFERTFSTRWEW
jgi:hypothetical protein